MEDKEFKSLDEYNDEFDKSGEKNFYEFLERKKQEALETGNQDLDEHIETIYNEAYEEEQKYYMYLAEEYRREKEEEERKRQEETEANDYYDESFYYEDYLKSLIEKSKKELESDEVDKYEELLKRIDENRRYIEGHKEELEDESLDEDDRYYHKDIIRRCERDIKEYTEEIKEIEFKREIVNFVTSLENMTKEEIEEEYISLLEERDSYLFMADNEIEATKDKLRIDNDKIGLIEAYVKGFPETQKLIQAQKEKHERMAKKRKQTGNVPIGETLHRAKTQEELANMQEEELKKIITNNDQTIEENNVSIKRALVQKILDQQETISEQQTEMNRLDRQKKEL